MRKLIILAVSLAGLQTQSVAQPNTFPANGNVGIGTTTPAQNLDVKGVVRWGNSTDHFYSGQDGLGVYLEQVGSNAAQSKIRLQTSRTGTFSNYCQFFIDPENGFSFMAMGSGNGNVGIGTSTPSEKLSVNGKIRAKEVKVEVAPWPDYVFDEDYKLEKLERLEKFIQVNNHLPEIPSAKEVRENGINLGEMNAKLLKKIEELTLHIIDLNKRMLEMEKH